jgi:succinate dehydrogenase flavin-adding protein (antitoxin of CptAB toxin-antitoxin module)
MRELDELLLNYLERRYPTADEADKAAFQSLLTLPDPELASYLLQQRTQPPELTRVIQDLLDRSDT